MFAKILVVEDDIDLRNVLVDKLNLLHHEITQAEDGEQAVAKFLSHKPDLVILDLLLPKLNGFGVLDSLHKQADLSNTPIIIYSNFNKPEFVKKAKDFNINNYYLKAQTRIEDLCAKVQQVLKEKELKSLGQTS